MVVPALRQVFGIAKKRVVGPIGRRCEAISDELALVTLGATEAELNRMAELARHRDARTIVIGRGRSVLAAAAAAAFARRWEAEGRIVLDLVT